MSTKTPSKSVAAAGPSSPKKKKKEFKEIDDKYCGKINKNRRVVDFLWNKATTRLPQVREARLKIIDAEHEVKELSKRLDRLSDEADKKVELYNDNYSLEESQKSVS